MNKLDKMTDQEIVNHLRKVLTTIVLRWHNEKYSNDLIAKRLCINTTLVDDIVQNCTQPKEDTTNGNV